MSEKRRNVLINNPNKIQAGNEANVFTISKQNTHKQTEDYTHVNQRQKPSDDLVKLVPKMPKKQLKTSTEGIAKRGRL